MHAIHRRVAVAAVFALVGALPAASDGRSRTTVGQTIVDSDRDNRLEPGPGESYVVRDDLGQALPTRTKTRQELFFFGQLTDTHVIDEESPLRVEFLDRFGPPFTAAYRPQEGLSTQVLISMVAQLRNTTSPITGRQLQLGIATGDSSDNTQLNETRWFIDLMDGGGRIDPNSGVPGSCGTTPNHLYDGVRGGNDYYEPNSSTTPGNDNEDGPGYSPDQAENEREAQRSSSVRDFPGLFEDENKPYQATGLGVPWYSVFGNHDALLQGNAPRNPAYEQIATGCTKVSNLDSASLAQIQALAAGGVTPAEQAQIYKIATDGEAAAASGSPDEQNNASTVNVPSDPNRRPLKKSEWMQQHCDTTGTPVCHGFTQQDIASGMGYYSFKPRPGLRFVVLDSIAENGGDAGNIDNTQFGWLHDQLRDAESQHELVLVFAHHSLETMNQSPLSVFGAGDEGGDPDPLVHYGMTDASGMTQPCVLTDPALPPTADETLRCLFLRHPSVIGFVNGHEHNNRVNAFERKDGQGKTLGGFWQINTASHIDWPQQSRTIDVVDDRDGNLSLFGTVIDQGGAPNPGGAPAPAGDSQGQSPESVSRLASISRELSYNDPDAQNGEDGRGDARGSRADRNVELVVRNPYAT
jgi:metallophosphoesterase (TIGR03767 family)